MRCGILRHDCQDGDPVSLFLISSKQSPEAQRAQIQYAYIILQAQPRDVIAVRRWHVDAVSGMMFLRHDVPQQRFP
jgi:hypothetical protein